MRAAGGGGHRGDEQVAEAVPGLGAADVDRRLAGEAEPGHGHVGERDGEGEQPKGQGGGQDADRDRALALDDAGHRVHDQAARPGPLQSGLATGQHRLQLLAAPPPPPGRHGQAQTADMAS
ncbi:MAG: hypothetical protein ACJ782_08840, partial [Actinomycetota bacterium]